MRGSELAAVLTRGGPSARSYRVRASQATFRPMSPRQNVIDPTKGLLVVEWPLFGELSRALALKVARTYDPEFVVGVATAGVVPGAVIAAILDRPFAAITVSRRYRAETVR